MTAEPLKTSPWERHWWQPWKRWNRAGELIEANGLLTLLDGRERAARSIALESPFVVHLECWPVDEDGPDAWVSMKVRQDQNEFELSARLPWSAVPENTPFKMSTALVMDSEAFLGLWTQLRTHNEMHGARQGALRAVEVGYYSAAPRQPPISEIEVAQPTPAEQGPGFSLRDMPWFGTSNAIFTLGINTRGFFVVGMNCEGVIAIGFNLKGVITVGFNGSAAIIGLGFNMLSPAVIVGFNLLSPLVLMGFNAVTPDVTGTTGTVIRIVMSVVLMGVLGGISWFHRGRIRKLRKEGLSHEDVRISIVLHRYHQWGYALGALLMLISIPVWILVPDLPQILRDMVFG